MKYYLIKAKDVVLPPNDSEVKCVELTKEELEAIANEKKYLTSSVDYIKGTDKIRKVLE